MGAGDFLKFDKDALLQSSSTLNEASAAIGKELSGLASTASNLSAQWTGEANEAYTVAQAKWDDAFQKLTAILDATTQALDGAAQLYGRSEKANGLHWPS
jgi:WXG100 family type VII secretion target